MSGTEHLSTQQLEEAAAGLTSLEARVDLDAHLGACEHCAQRMASVVEAREGFLARNPPELRASQLLSKAREREEGQPAAWRRWLLPAVPTLAAASLAIVFMVGEPTPPGPTVTAKGEAGVAFMLRPVGGGTSRVAKSGEALRAGDVIHIELQATGTGWAAVFGLDVRGECTLLWEGARSGPGRLPLSLEVDGDPEPEQLLLVTHDAPVPVAVVQSAARKAIEAAGDLGDASAFAIPGHPEAQVHRFLVRKQR